MDSKQTFTLQSDELGGQGTKRQEADSLGGEGDNVSPQLSWNNAPQGTKSFAVTLHDADAPTAGGFWHWLIYDIPADVSELVSGAGDVDKGLAPESAKQSLTDFGVSGYGGPAPPAGHGLHEYKMTVYALSCEQLGPSADTPAGQVAFNIWNHVLAKSSLIFYYEK